METEIILTPLQEIGWKIFEDLCPNMRYEIAKHLLDTKDIYIIKNVFELLNEYHRCELSKQLLDVKHFPIIETVFGILEKEHRYKFLMNYNLRKIEKLGGKWGRSILYHHFNIYEGIYPPHYYDVDIHPVIKNWEDSCVSSESEYKFWKKYLYQEKLGKFVAKAYTDIERQKLFEEHKFPGEKHFLQSIYSRKRIQSILQEYEQKQEYIESQINFEVLKHDLKLDRWKNDHHYWCKSNCKDDHTYENEYIYRQLANLNFEASIRAVKIAIKRFQKVYQKKYPNSKIEIDAYDLAEIVFERLRPYRCFIYELEIELIPLTERIYQIKYLTIPEDE